MAKILHAMLRVLEEARSVEFYKDAFGLDTIERFDFADFTLIYMRNDQTSFELELTVNKGRTDPYDLGDGYGHLAVCVEDLDAEHARFEAAGYGPRKIVAFQRDGVLFARFFFVQDPDGYQIEVMQKHGRFQ